MAGAAGKRAVSVAAAPQFSEVEDLYAELRGLRALRGFSSEWHKRFEDVVARVPFPPRSFGPSAEGLPSSVAPPPPLTARPNGATAAAAAATTKPSGHGAEVCVTCKSELPPPPKRLRCHACRVKAGAADAAADPWLHDGSDPAVVRTRDEYLVRFAHLEAEAASLRRRVADLERAATPATPAPRGKPSPRTPRSSRKSPRRGRGAAKGSAASAGDDDDDEGTSWASDGDDSGPNGAARSLRRTRNPSLALVESIASSMTSPSRASKRARRSANG